jgi:hypothetical protein
MIKNEGHRSLGMPFSSVNKHTLRSIRKNDAMTVDMRATKEACLIFHAYLGIQKASDGERNLGLITGKTLTGTTVAVRIVLLTLLFICYLLFVFALSGLHSDPLRRLSS